MDPSTPGWLLQTLIGAVIGVALGVPISWWFARRNSVELKEAATELRDATVMVMRAQEAQASRPVFNRDADGNIIGVHQYLEMTDSSGGADMITALGESVEGDRAAKNDADA